MPTDLWRRQQALRIWDEARPLIGTPAEIYLRRRRIALLPRALRFHPRTPLGQGDDVERSEEHTSELQSLMRISYAVFCLKKKKETTKTYNTNNSSHHSKRPTSHTI